jgi:hypothetical protein
MRQLAIPGLSHRRVLQGPQHPDRGKSGELNIDNDTIQRLHARTVKFAALFSSTDETALRLENRSRSAYHSVIAGAVSRLPRNIREARRALYDRAEIALVAELLQVHHLTDEQVAVERLALERAIRKVERDARKKEQPRTSEQERRRWSFSSFRGFFRVFRPLDLSSVLARSSHPRS